MRFILPALAALALLLAVLAAALRPPPPPAFAAVRAAHQPSEAWLLDRHGVVLQEQRVDFRIRRLPWAALAEISPALTRAVVAAEDRRFYRHAGVDGRALAAAAGHALSGSGGRGASTIAMQVAALLDPRLRPAGGARRDPVQKARQLWAALALERAWGKPQVLEAYLNLAPWRGELVGVRAAARGLFDKPPAALNAREAALLAALLRAPNAAPARVARRACRLAPAAECPALQALAGAALGRAPVIRPAATLAPQLAQRLLHAPGDRVGTSLDAAVQRAAAAALGRHLSALDGHHLVRDGAVLVLDNASGEVLAYVANRGAAGSARHVDGVRARRQAGSTLKPFLYGLAFERRLLTPASPLDDSPVRLATPAGLYVPQNYDRSFRGLVSAREALASSLNVPAVRVLLLTGLEPFHETLHAFGLDLAESGGFYGYALALGAPEVSLWELTNAYRALANGGLAGPARLSPQDSRQNLRPVPRAALSPAAAFLVADVLADRAARAPTFGLESPLAGPAWAAVKTGTSKDMRDNWCVGFSRRHTVGVWVGNFDNRPMRAVSGVTGAAPVWLEVMTVLRDMSPDVAAVGAHDPASPGGTPRAGGDDGHAAGPTGYPSEDGPDGAPRPFTGEGLAASGSGPPATPGGAETLIHGEARRAAEAPGTLKAPGQAGKPGETGMSGGDGMASDAKTPSDTGMPRDSKAPGDAGVSDGEEIPVTSTALGAPPPPAGVVRARVVFADRRAPARTEWFLAGTEPGAAIAAARPAARIRTPGDGSTIALDPDIPPARQRVLFRADAAAGGRWALNGIPLAPADRAYAWAPRPGRFELSLLDAEGRTLDRRRFVVR